MFVERKSLLVRADFVLGRGLPVDRLSYRRWRKVLGHALPTLVGFARRCPRAEHVCLHDGDQEGHFTAWFRIPVRRQPNRKWVRKLAARLYQRFEEALRPIHGELMKIGIRRQVEGRATPSPAPEFMPLFTDREETVAKNPTTTPVAEMAQEPLPAPLLTKEGLGEVFPS